MSLGPITYSIRRGLLDRDLEAEAGRLSGSVLEVGCGRTGRRGNFRPPSTGITRWIYLDRDLSRGPHVCGDATHLPIASCAFDTILCLEVLEYVWKPVDALSEMRRLLKPGGRLLLSTPFFHRADAADDYWRFTEPALRRLLQEAGFEDVRCIAQGHAMAAAASVLRYAVSLQRVQLRRVLSLGLRPVFSSFLRRDASLSARFPELRTFSTGYLTLARRPPASTGEHTAG